MPGETKRILQHRSAAWFDAVSSRRSQRSFNGHKLAEDDLEAIVELAEDFRPYDDARCAVVQDADPALFTGFVGSYGSVTGAPHALLMIASDTRRAQQHAGYTGEALVLEATARDIDTCWIGGSFDSEKAAGLVDLAEGERVVCVSPLGYRTERESLKDQLMHAVPRSHSRRPISEIAPKLTEEWPAWARVAVECARLAPSAVNRQPWRFDYVHDGLAIYVTQGRGGSVPREIDCGIAMLHGEIGARQCVSTAEWTESAGTDELAVLQVEDDDW